MQLSVFGNMCVENHNYNTYINDGNQYQSFGLCEPCTGDDYDFHSTYWDEYANVFLRRIPEILCTEDRLFVNACESDKYLDTNVDIPVQNDPFEGKNSRDTRRV